MKTPAIALIAVSIACLASPAMGWDAATSPKLKPDQPADLLIDGRAFEVFAHGTRAEWGYPEPQEDTFIVVHPKAERSGAPLYVVLHSAGHDVYSALRCTRQLGNHDMYRAPGDFYALYLDCRANRGDWWWGGMHRGDAGLTRRNAGGHPMPVERRVLDCVRWTMAKYRIDTERVYLSGISMGGSGTLGIGLRNGDLFAAVKATVPAGIEHVSERMFFPPRSLPPGAAFPDPPIVVDYSAQNDGWSAGHELFVRAMNERKYALYLSWGPFGHAHNHSEIEKVNDLVNAFDWLNVRKDRAYPVFATASCNDPLPWPNDLKSQASGQVNAFFRWQNLEDTPQRLRLALFLVTPADLKTAFNIPAEATADVTLRRVQRLVLQPGAPFRWRFGPARGTGRTDGEGRVTIPGLKISGNPAVLEVRR